MLDVLITSKTRVKLLLKFFLNTSYTSYLRNLETEFGESSNSIRLELNRFEKAGLLCSYNEGNKKYYKANMAHPLFSDIHNIILKYVGIDQIIDKVVKKLGDLEKVFLTGDFAKGKYSSIIDLVFISGNINKTFLLQLVEKVEILVNHKIRYLVLTPIELKNYIKITKESDVLLLWEA
jgi:hypothetical protein